MKQLWNIVAQKKYKKIKYIHNASKESSRIMGAVIWTGIIFSLDLHHQKNARSLDKDI